VAEARRAVASNVVAGGPSVTLGATTPATVRADRRRLAQVLRNLLRNAVAHTPASGSVRVEVAPAAEPGFVDVAVVDDGEGIPAEHLPLVWERFHRVDPSRSRATGGMGLGLAVVRQLVVGMGGRVRTESEPGRGSRFVVTLRGELRGGA
jgi:signal transduction histidine kinase